MSRLTILRQYDGDISFDRNAMWIDAAAAQTGEWIWAEGTFRKTSKTALLISAGDGAHVYINGELVHRFVVRSYVFDKAYEALDITDVLKDGENTISILFRHSDLSGNNGCIFEVTDGTNTLVSDGKLAGYRCEAQKPGVNFYISGSGYEVYDASKPKKGSKTELRVLGPVGMRPFEKMRQSRLESQDRYYADPENIESSGRWSEENGFRGVLAGLPENCGCAVYYIEINCGKAEELTPYIYNRYIRLTLDGKDTEAGKTAKLAKGRHLLAVTAGTPSVFLKTDAEIVNTVLMPLSVKPPKRIIYPWADANVQEPVPEDELKYTEAVTVPEEKTVPAEVKKLSHTDSLKSISHYHSDDITQNGGVIIRPSDKGAYVTFDFGTEQAGYPVIDLETEEKLKLITCCYEVIGENGDVYVGDRNDFMYISVPGKQTYTAFSRRGFRYLKVFVSKNEKDVRLSVRCENSHCHVETPDFKCSDPLLEKVYKMSADTSRVCMLDYYVDCPGYEQNVWVGDARITALVNLTCFGKYGMNAEYIKLISESMSDKLTEYYRTNNPRYVQRRFLPCACFPTYPDGNIAVWSYQWVLGVYDHYIRSGDIETVKSVLPAIEETLRRSEDWFSPRGLLCIEGTWNLIEWANNDIAEYGEVVCNSMMLKGCYDKAALLEKAAGCSSLAEEYSKKAAALKKRINAVCWDESLDMYPDTVKDDEAYKYYLSYCENTLKGPPAKQREPMPIETFKAMKRRSIQTAVFAVLFGIAEGRRLEKCAKLIRDNVESGEYVAGSPSKRTHGLPTEKETPGGTVKIGSPFFMYFVLDALYRLGDTALCEKAIKRDWGKMLDLGIRNCTEVFNEEGKITTRSIAHAWSASPAYFISEKILGVVPLEPGYRIFTVKPECSSLSSAAGTVRTPYGDIKVSWKRSGEKYDIECECPSELRWEK